MSFRRARNSRALRAFRASMRLVLPTTLLLLLAAAPPAPAAVPLRVTLSSCASGPAAEDRRAAFTASMPARSGATSLRMRFVLQRASGKRWRTVSAPSFGRWERSRHGASGFRYRKRVDGLWGPGRFRVAVRFAWRDGAGRTVARATRRSKPCVQPDRRAALRVLSLRATARPDGLADYTAVIANRGRGDAGDPFEVVLGVAGRNLAADPVETLEAGRRVTVRVTGPPCHAGETVRITADAGRVIPQRRRADDRLDVPCPL